MSDSHKDVKKNFDKIQAESEESEKYFCSDIKDQWNFFQSLGGNKSHNLILGVPNLGDTTLFYQMRSVKDRPFIRRSEIITYPPKYSTDLKKATITGIAIIDSRKDGTGGEGKIINGGIGANFVEIELTSEWYRGYEFTVYIIGKYTKN
jgi:hypothetical protein